MKITKSLLKQIIKEELENVVEMLDPNELPRRGEDESAEDESAFTPEEGIEAAKEIQMAAARLKQVLEGLREGARGLKYDSMDLALSSLRDMKTEVHLDRIIHRLGRFKQ